MCKNVRKIKGGKGGVFGKVREEKKGMYCKSRTFGGRDERGRKKTKNFLKKGVDI